MVLFHFQKISQVKMVQKGLCQKCEQKNKNYRMKIKTKPKSSKFEKMKTQNISKIYKMIISAGKYQRL